MAEKKIIAVTGANGFVGSHVVTAALQQGMEVHAIVRTPEAATRLEGTGADIHVCADYGECDLLVAMCNCNAVVHTVSTNRVNDAELYYVNVGITDRVAKAAADAGVSRMIYMSGLGIEREDVADAQLQAHLRSKRAAEQAIVNYPISHIFFRPSFIIGPGGDTFVPAIMDAISTGTVHVPGDERTSIQPISIDDAVAIILKACQGMGEDNCAYDLVGSQEILVTEFATKVYEAISGTGIRITQPAFEFVPRGEVPAGTDESWDFLQLQVTGDPRPLIDMFGIEPAPIDEAITRSVVDFLKPDDPVPEKRAVMLLSGGLDSVTALYYMRSQGYEVIPISMFYKDRPEREKFAVKKICESLGIAPVEVPVEYIQEVFDLKLAGFPVPSVFGSVPAYVPYRNLVFNAIATYWADVYAARYIISGHIATDELPDANLPFFDAMEQLVANIKVGNKAVAPKYILPLKGMTKADGVRLAMELGVPLQWTWSCACNTQKPCGKCRPCCERAQGFAEAGYEDPSLTFNPAGET
jgi:7-cyano-7-deazaguanine synthase